MPWIENLPASRGEKMGDYLREKRVGAAAFLVFALFSLSSCMGHMPMKGMGGMMGSKMKAGAKSRDGRKLYLAYCAGCHGKRGDGKGEYASTFQTPPADFTKGVYKFKETRQGTPPTDEDILRTLTLGARGTGMVPQAHLSREQKEALVKYLKTLSPRFKKEEPFPLKLPKKIEKSQKLVEAGRRTFQQNCATCHGEKGNGRGPVAKSLPVPPADLTSIPYKRGEREEDIVWALLAGREGTPMPSFEKSMSAKELWAVAYYVRSLQKKRKPVGMMGLVGEEQKAMHMDMEAIMAWRHGRMPMRVRVREK